MKKTTKPCPYCCEEIKTEAIKCRWCGSTFPEHDSEPVWSRDLPSRWFLGVCAVLSTRSGISVIFWRVLFVIATIVYGVGPIVYLSIWAITPFRHGEETFLERCIGIIQEIFGNKSKNSVDQT